MMAKKIVRIIEKSKELYYRLYFKAKIGSIPANLKILGPIYFFNSNVEIGSNVTLYPGVTFFGDGKITIADNCKIGQNVIIYAGTGGGVTIDTNTSIAAQAYIIDSNHETDRNFLIQDQGSVSEKIYIGKDVWLGANVTVIKGAHIKNGSVIGAKTLVNNVTEEYSVNVGIPSRKIGERS